MKYIDDNWDELVRKGISKKYGIFNDYPEKSDRIKQFLSCNPNTVRELLSNKDCPMFEHDCYFTPIDTEDLVIEECEELL